MRETSHECYVGNEPTVLITPNVAREPMPAPGPSAPSAAPTQPLPQRRENGNEAEEGHTTKRVRTSFGAASSSTASPQSPAGARNSALVHLRSALLDSRQQLQKAETALSAALDEEDHTLRDASRPARVTSVTHATLSDVLPSDAVTTTLVDLFFVEMDWFVVCIFRPWFVNAVWQGGLRSGKAVSCAQGALFCVMLAQSALMVPPSHPTLDTTVITEPQRDALIERALFLLDCDDRLEGGWKSTAHRPPTLPRIQTEMLLTYYFMYTGHLQAAYDRLGRALRLAKQIGLFDCHNREWNSTSSGRFELLQASTPRDKKTTSGSAQTATQRSSPPKHSQQEHFRSFLPRSAAAKAPSALELEMKKRLAWDLIILDWWHGLSWRRPPDLPQAFVDVPLPSYLADHHFNEVTGETLPAPPIRGGQAAGMRPPSAMPSPAAAAAASASPAVNAPTMNRVNVTAEFIAKIHLTQKVPEVMQFLRHMSSMTPDERYFHAHRLEAEFDEWSARYQVPLRHAETALETDDPSLHRRAAQTLINHTSAGYLRCILHKCFLSDRFAPDDLRAKSLIHARSVMEAIPVLTDLVHSQHIYFEPSWCAEHLFHAATAFAYVLLTRADDNEAAAGTKQSAELNWFAERVSHIIFTLTHLGDQSATARVCEKLLSRLCDSKEMLRATMKRLDEEARQRAAIHRSGDLKSDGQSWREGRFTRPQFRPLQDAHRIASAPVVPRARAASGSEGYTMTGYEAEEMSVGHPAADVRLPSPSTSPTASYGSRNPSASMPAVGPHAHRPGPHWSTPLYVPPSAASMRPPSAPASAGHNMHSRLPPPFSPVSNEEIMAASHHQHPAAGAMRPPLAPVHRHPAGTPGDRTESPRRSSHEDGSAGGFPRASSLAASSGVPKSSADPRLGEGPPAGMALNDSHDLFWTYLEAMDWDGLLSASSNALLPDVKAQGLSSSSSSHPGASAAGENLGAASSSDLSSVDFALG